MLTSLSDTFEGDPIVTHVIAITGANFALSEAVQSDPQTLHLGDTIHIVLECEVVKVRHEPVKDTDGLARVHVLKAALATIVDADLVGTHLETQRERNLVASEKARGIVRLPLDDDQIDTLIDDHENGRHADRLADGCPACDEETDLDQAGL